MVKASDFQKTLELEVIHAGSNSRLNIEDSDINRPGLQLAGFLDTFRMNGLRFWARSR